MTFRSRKGILVCPGPTWLAALVLAGAAISAGQGIRMEETDKWVTVQESAAGTSAAAKDQAVAAALRKAVEEACGSFLTSVSKATDYKTVYDKVLASTVGYVIEHQVVRTWIQDGATHVQVRAHVSTQAFSKKWAQIAHTIEQENNPRCIVAVGEDVQVWPIGKVSEVKEAGTVQSKLEDFLLSKGLLLMDRGATESVSKRDVLLAALKGDPSEIAAMGARFRCDVFIVGNCTAKFGRTIEVAGQKLHQFTATLNVRVIRVDSSQLLASKTFGPVTTNTLQRQGGEDKVMAKLGDEAAPQLLKAVIEAWRKQVNVRRNVTLQVAGMDYKKWKALREEAGEIRGLGALRLREITQGVAQIDAEYSYGVEDLADKLTELKTVKLEVEEITANRIKLKVAAK